MEHWNGNGQALVPQYNYQKVEKVGKIRDPLKFYLVRKVGFLEESGYMGH